MVRLADYQDAQDRQSIGSLLKIYSGDPMGGGNALTDEVIAATLDGLSERSYAHSVLAFLDNQAVGLINCLEGFSTFHGKPLINIHDIVVDANYRGRGIAQQLLAFVEQFARDRKCCKLTLEVLQNNHSAHKAYSNFGFANYQLDPSAGHALFLQKLLD